MAPINVTGHSSPIPKMHSFWDHNKYYFIGGIAVFVGLVVVVAFIIMVVCLKRRMGTQSETAGRKEARKHIQAALDLSQNQMRQRPTNFFFAQMLLRSSQVAQLTKASDFSGVSKRVHETSGKGVKAYMDEILYNRKPLPDNASPEVRRVMDAEFVRSDRTKYPDREIMECTQAPAVGQHVKEKDHWCLHANTLPDIYGNSFVISQAPSKVLFEFHWEVVWQRKVGVIVLLSPFSKRGGIEPYFNLTPGTEMNCGRFDVRTASAVRYQNLYSAFILALRNRNTFTTVDPHGQENREILMIQIERWPTNRREANVPTIALLAEMIRSLALDQAKKHRLPGVWTHCSTGSEKSATFYAIYVCRQMHYRYRSINVMGALKLVDKMRYKAFHCDNAFEHIQIVHAVIAEFIANYGVGKENPEKFSESVRAMADAYKKAESGYAKFRKSVSTSKVGSSQMTKGGRVSRSPAGSPRKSSAGSPRKSTARTSVARTRSISGGSKARGK